MGISRMAARWVKDKVSRKSKNEETKEPAEAGEIDEAETELSPPQSSPAPHAYRTWQITIPAEATVEDLEKIYSALGIKIPANSKMNRGEMISRLQELLETKAISETKIREQIDNISGKIGERALLIAAGKLLSPEQQQKFLGPLKSRFDALPQLHRGVQWTDVEKSLKADPESMAKLQALDAKGHKMNVFGEENGEFVFASGWNNVEEVSEDHRNVVFDKEAQEYREEKYPKKKCNGNATDIVKALGVNLADPKFHEQLRKAVDVDGLAWAWLKTDASTRKSGYAVAGNKIFGIYGDHAREHDDLGSFRASLRVKKA
jgi:hypothetical protein